MSTTRATLTNGINHVALMTADLDRFVEFYTGTLGLEEIFSEQTPAFRHAILRSGDHSWLHPIELTGGRNGDAAAKMFERGHLDHIALTAACERSFAELRRRLVARGASDGQVHDLGAFHSLWFTDPDGMQAELSLIVDPRLSRFHAPSPRVETWASDTAIECLNDDHARAGPLWKEYLPWVAQRMQEEYGWQVEDLDGMIQHHHALVDAQMPSLTGPRGRLLLASRHGEAVGAVALQPVDALLARVKRMVVRPEARGQGIGRALLNRLVEEAREIGYRRLRLETLGFMTQAIALYRSLGFIDAAPDPQSELTLAGLSRHVRFMELALT